MVGGRNDGLVEGLTCRFLFESFYLFYYYTDLREALDHPLLDEGLLLVTGKSLLSFRLGMYGGTSFFTRSLCIGGWDNGAVEGLMTLNQATASIRRAGI